MDRVDSNRLPIDSKQVVFSKRQLKYLEDMFGNREQLSMVILPDASREELLYKAGEQHVLDAIRTTIV